MGREAESLNEDADDNYRRHSSDYILPKREKLGLGLGKKIMSRSCFYVLLNEVSHFT
jgi:hypothetical protein